MTTNILLSGKYLLLLDFSRAYSTDSHAFRRDRIADFFSRQAFAWAEGALVSHIHAHRELRSVYGQYHRRSRGFPKRFLWRKRGGGIDCPDGCKHPVYLVSAIRQALIHTFASREFPSLLSCFRFGFTSVPRTAPDTEVMTAPR